jgi:hypothetical protein
MCKKFIILKCGISRRVYVEDIARVYTVSQRKTPRVPRVGDGSDIESEIRLIKELEFNTNV